MKKNKYYFRPDEIINVDKKVTVKVDKNKNKKEEKLPPEVYIS